MGFASFIKETIADAAKTLTSKEGLKSLYGVSLYRNAIYLMLSRGVTAILGFAFWILAARFYSASDVGLASGIISAAGLLALLSTLGLDYGLIRFLPTSGERANITLNSSFTVAGLLSLVFAFIFIAGISLWSPTLAFLRQDLIWLISFVVFTVAYTLYPLMGTAFVAKRRAGFDLVLGIIDSLVRVALVIPLAAFFQSGGIIASWLIGFVAAIVVAILLLLPQVQAGYHFSPVIRREVMNEMAHFSLANYAVVLIWTFPNFALPLMVVNRLGAETNAYFYIAWSIAGFLYTIAIATSYSLFAEGSHDEERLGQDIKRGLKLVFILLIPAIILVLLIGDKVLLLFGRAYSENATSVLRILAASAFPLSINYIYFSMRRVQKKMKSVIWFTALVAVGTLGLSWVLLPRMGILGVGVAWLVSQGIATLIIVCNLWRPIKLL
jgi:O-antigen/teichoic acid export membrane protein